MYQFSLIPKDGSKRIQPVSIDYTPIFHISKQQNLEAVPIFNLDKEISTPAFVLEYDIPFLQQNLKMHQKLFAERIKQAKLKTKQLLIPKPKHRISFCSVCKQEYSDYLTHIYSKQHKKQVQQSPYMKKIKHFTTEVSGEQSISNSQDKKSIDQLNYPPQVSEDTQLFQENINKKVKLNPEENHE